MAEHRAESERNAQQSSELRSSLADSSQSLLATKSQLKNVEQLRVELTNENRMLREQNAKLSDELRTASGETEKLKTECQNATLRETSLRAELNGVRERHDVEQQSTEMSRRIDALNQSVMKSESENRCMRTRIEKLGKQLAEQTRLADKANELVCQTTAKVTQSEAAASELRAQINTLESRAKRQESTFINLSFC